MGAEVFGQRLREDAWGAVVGHQEGVTMETTVGLSEGNGARWEGLEHGGSGYWVVGKWEWHWCAVGMVWSCLVAGLLVGSLLKKGGRESVCVCVCVCVCV